MAALRHAAVTLDVTGRGTGDPKSDRAPLSCQLPQSVLGGQGHGDCYNLMGSGSLPWLLAAGS